MVVVGNPYRVLLALSRAIVSAHVRPPGEPADDRIKLLGKAETLPGKKYISSAFGVMIERAQDNVRPPREQADDRSFRCCLL